MTGRNERDDSATERRRPTNLTASVNQRLLTLARQRHEEFQSVLTRYALERLLYRLGSSPHSAQFVLKGALLFSLWQGDPHRATRDLDLLGYGSPDIQRLLAVFRDLCQLPSEDDGVRFLADSVSAVPIREDQEYGGTRVHLLAMLGKARIQLQIDIGFGDAVTPAPKDVSFPTMLDSPAPHVLAYPRETVVAEKFEAMVRLGMANTRMKDFYDLWVLAQRFAFDGTLVRHALEATFARRGTPLPEGLPLPFSPTFYEDAAKQAQWRAFLRKARLEPTTVSLQEVVGMLVGFLLPPTHAAVGGAAFDAKWKPGGPWQSSSAERASESSGQ